MLPTHSNAPCCKHHTQSLSASVSSTSQLTAGACSADSSATTKSGGRTALVDLNAPYVPPSRAILLQLTQFPAEQLSLFLETGHGQQPSFRERFPVTCELLQRAASMRVLWEAESAGAADAASSSSASSPLQSQEDADPGTALALRLLGLSSLERATAAVRAASLSAARARSGVSSSPAASFPPIYGKSSLLRMHLATNHLPTMLAVEGRRKSMASEADAHMRAQAAHCTPVAFLGTQKEDRAEGNSSLPRHSSVPLRDDPQRQLYIQRIVHHCAQQLGLGCADRSSQQASAAVPAAAASGSQDVFPSAHILLLHIDAISLFGPVQEGEVNVQARATTAFTFVEQLLSALASQLHSPHAPTVNAMLPSLNSSASAAFTSPRLCPELLWGLMMTRSDIVDSSDSCPAFTPTASPAADVLAADLLSVLRPVQSYRVQEGYVSAPSPMRACDAFLLHADTTRMRSAVDMQSATFSVSCPLQGSLHVNQFVRELIFKLGMGSKYGA
jgi:hypothetical protein